MYEFRSRFLIYIFLAHSETHRLAWEVLKRTKEVNQLQQALGDFQAAVFEERKKTLAVVAENDALKSEFLCISFSMEMDSFKRFETGLEQSFAYL